MKHRLWSICLLIAALLCAVCWTSGALAENPESPLLEVANATEPSHEEIDGVVTYSGSYYYKVNINLPEGADSFQVAFSNDPEVTAENAYWNDRSVESFRSGHVGFNMYAGETGETDVILVRLNDQDENVEKIILEYDSTKKTSSDEQPITGDNPQLLQDYTYTWEDLEADFYFLHMGIPGEEPFFVSARDCSYEVTEENGRLAALLGSVGEYHIWLEAMVDNQSVTYDVWDFYLDCPDAAEGFTLVANWGETDSVTVNLHDGIHFDAQVDLDTYGYPVAFQAFLGYDVYSPWVNPDNGETSYDWWPVRPLPEGTSFTYFVYARARFGEDGDWIYSNSIAVTVNMDDTIEGSLTYSVVDMPMEGILSVARDSEVIVIVNNLEGVDYYCAYIGDDANYPEVESHWVPAEAGDTTTVALPVAMCEADKDYEVHVCAIKYGAPKTIADESFTIHVEEKDGEGDFIFNIKDSYITMERISASVHYENPDNIEEGLWMIVTIGPDERPDNELDWFGSGSVDFWGERYITTPDQYRVLAVVYHGDEEEPVASDSFVFTVYANGGEVILSEPAGLPDATVSTGEDLSFTVTRPTKSDETNENPVFYDVEVLVIHNDGGEEPLYLQEGLTDDSTQVDIPGKKISEPGTNVRVSVYGYCMNAYDNALEYNFRVVPGDPSNQLDITIAGLDKNNNLPIYQKATLIITADEDLGPIQTVRIFNGYEYWDDDNPKEPHRDTRFIEFGDVDTFYVFAMVTFDTWLDDYNRLDYDPRVWYCTDTLPVHATAESDASAFSVSLSKYESVTQGDTLTVTYTPSETVGYDTNYWVDVCDANGDWLFAGAEITVPKKSEVTGYTAQLLTASLPEGEYRVYAHANGAGHGTKDADELSFSIVGAQDFGPVLLRVDVPENGSILPCQTYQFAAYAPGADWIEIYPDYERNMGWHYTLNKSGKDQDAYGGNGIFELRAEAHYIIKDENGDPANWMGDHWEEYPVQYASVSINVHSDNYLQIVWPEGLPSYIFSNVENDIEFTVSKPANADTFNVHIWKDVPEGEDGELGTYSDMMEDERTFTIKAADLPEAGSFVHVDIDAWGYGYSDDHVGYRIPVLEQPAENLALTVVELEDENRIPVNVNVMIQIEADQSIKTVEIFDGDGFRGHDNPDEHSNHVYKTWKSFDQDGDYIVFARVTFDDWDDSYYDYGDQRTWYYTNAVEVHAYSNGPTGDFTFALDNNQYERCSLIQVTYEKSENATDYWSNFEHLEENDEWHWCGSFGNYHVEEGDEAQSFTAYIDTATLAAGEYRVSAVANAAGFISKDSTTAPIQFTITEPDLSESDGILFKANYDTEPFDIYCNQDYQLSAYAPGASWIEVFFDYHEDDEGHSDRWDGDSFEDTRRYDRAGEYTLVARAHYDELSDVDENGEPWEDGQEHWIEVRFADSAPITVNVTSKVEITVDKPEGLPAYATVGQDITFTVSKPENAEVYSIDVWKDTDSEEEEGDLGSVPDLDEDECEITISADDLPAADYWIHVAVNAGAEDSEWVRQEWHLRVVPASDNRVTLTVEGLGEGNSIPVHANATIRINAENAIKTVCVFNGDDYWDHESMSEDGVHVYERGISFWDNRTYIVYAMVTFDDWDDYFYEIGDQRNWIYTNAVEVHATADNGEVGNFNFALDNNEYARGDMIQVTYTKSDFATHYWSDIDYLNEYGDWEWVRHTGDLYVEEGDESESFTTYIDTISIPAGTYRIAATSEAVGFLGRGSETTYIQFTITEPDLSESNSILFRADKDNMLTREGYCLTAYAPNAKYFIIYFDYENDPGWNDIRHGDSFSDDFDYGHPGEYTLVAEAHYFALNDQGEEYMDEPDHWAETEPATLSITMTVSTNTEISISKPQGLPDYVVEGQDVDFTVDMPENAGWYFLDVWKDNDGEDGTLVHLRDLHEQTEVHISADELPEAGRWIHVNVDAYGLGAEDTYQHWNIPVISSSDHRLTLTVEGLGEDNSVLVNKNVKIRIVADESIKTVSIFDGDDYWNCDNPSENNDHVYECDISFGSDRTYSVYAMVTFDDWLDEYEYNGDGREWVYTNVVEVNATKEGDIEGFSFDLAKVTVDPETGDEERVPLNDETTVNQGEEIEITYHGGEHATHYWADVGYFDEGGNWQHLFHCADVYLDQPANEGDTYTAQFLSGSLSEGAYSIIVHAEAEGYVTAEDGREFTVAGQPLEDGSVLLQVSPTELDTYQEYRFSISAPGADWVELFYDYDDNDGWHDDWDEGRGLKRGGVFGTRSYDRSDEYKLVARAHYGVMSYVDENGQPWEDGEEHWLEVSSADSEPVIVRVNAPNGQIHAAAATGLPGYLAAGEDTTLDFSASMPENAEEYMVHVWWDYDGMSCDLGSWDHLTADRDFHLDIPAEKLPRAGECVLVDVRAWAYGYDVGDARVRIPVMDQNEVSNKLILTVNGESDTLADVPVNSDLTLRIESTGETPMKAIDVFNGHGYYWGHREPNQDDGSFEAGLGFGDVGTYPIYARVTFDDWDDSYNEIGDQRHWEYTNVVNVQTVAEGTAGAFTVDLDKHEVTQGDVIEITYTKSDFATNYWVQVDSLTNDYGIDGAHISVDPNSDGPFTAKLLTATLPEGEYKVKAYANAEGYKDAEARYSETLTVTGNDTPVLLQVDVDEGEILLPGRQIQISAYAQGADWITVYLDYDGNRGWYHHIDGESGSRQNTYFNCGTYVIIAEAHYFLRNEQGETYQDEPDHWAERIEQSDPITIEVESADKLQINTPQGLPSYFISGDERNFEFTVLKPDNAEWFDVEIWKDTDPDADGYLGGGNDLHNDQTYTIHWYDLPEADRYVYVNINAYAYGWDAAHLQLRIPVLKQTDDSALLTLDGETGPQQVAVNHNMKLRIEATGETPIQVVQVYNGYGYQWGDDYPDQDGSIERDIGFGDPGVYVVYAKVTFDEWKEEYNNYDYDPRVWVYTNAVEVVADAQGEVDPFDFSLSSNGQPVQRGDIITVTYNKTANANHYWVDIRYPLYYEDGSPDLDENGNQRWVWNHTGDVNTDPNDSAETYTIVIPTSTLPARDDYVVCAYAEGEGFISREANQQFNLVITEPEQSEEHYVRFSIATDDSLADEENNLYLVAHQRVHLSAYAPGANEIIVFYDYDGDRNNSESWGGDSFEDDRSYGRKGIRTVIARAFCYEENEYGEWVESWHVDSEPFTVYVTETTAIAITSAPQGNFNPSLSESAEALTITVYKPQNAEKYGLHVWIDGDQDNFFEYESGRNDPDHMILEDAYGFIVENLPLPRALSQGDVINMRVYAHAYGAESVERIWSFPVTSNSSTDALTLRVEGLESGHINVRTNARVVIESTPDQPIKKIRLFDGYNFWNEDDPDNDTRYSRNISFDEVGVYTVVAQVTFDDLPENWRDGDADTRVWYSTNSVVVEARALGATGSFDFNLGCDTDDMGRYVAHQGDVIPVTYDTAQNGWHYWVDVGYFDEGGYHHVVHGADLESYKGGTANLITADLNPGVYQLTAHSEWEGYLCGNGIYQKILVIEGDELQKGDIVFTVDAPDNLVTNQDYQMAVYAPEADWVEIFFDFDHSDDWTNSWGGDHSDIQWRAYEDAGTYKLLARAHYSDLVNDQGEPIEFVDSEPVTLTVTASKNVIVSKPEDLRTYYVFGIEPYFTVEKPQNADSFDVDIWVENGPSLYSVFRCEDDSLYVQPSLHALAEHENAKIWVRVYGRGYDANSAEAKWSFILRSEATNDAELTFTNLEVNDGAASIAYNGNANAMILLKGESHAPIQSVRLFDGDGWRDVWPNGEGEFRIDVGFGEPDREYAIYALVTFEGAETELATNVIKVTTGSSQGTLNQPVYTLASSTVKRGQPFVVHIDELQNKDEWYGGVIWWNDENGDYHETPYCHWNDFEHKVTYPTSDMELEPGDYNLSLWTTAEGWEGSGVTIPVTIEDANDGEIVVWLEKTSVTTQEQSNFSVYAKDAVEITVRAWNKDRPDNVFADDWSNLEYENHEYFTGRTGFGGHAITACFQATVHYADGTTKQSEVIEVAVTVEPNHDLTSAHVVGYWEKGQGFSFTFQPDPNADWYFFSVVEEGNDEHVLYATPENEVVRGYTNVNLSANDLANVRALRVNYYQANEGWNDYGDNVVIRPMDHSSMLLMPNGLTRIEDEAFADMPAVQSVRITANVTYIGSNAFMNCGNNFLAVFFPGPVTGIQENAFRYDSVTFYGNEGSEAEAYAKAHHISFVYLPPKE